MSVIVGVTDGGFDLARDLVERGHAVLFPGAAEAAGQLGGDRLERPDQRLARAPVEAAGAAHPGIALAAGRHRPERVADQIRRLASDEQIVHGPTLTGG